MGCGPGKLVDNGARNAAIDAHHVTKNAQDRKEVAELKATVANLLAQQEDFKKNAKSGAAGSGAGTKGMTAGEQETQRLAQILAAHLSQILSLSPVHPSIAEYVSILSEEGFESPEDFDEVAVDTLGSAPYNFKPGHLKKVSPHAVLL